MRAIDLAAFIILASAPALLAVGTSADVTEGRVAYGHYCSACHGMTGDGRGPVAAVLRKQPSDLRRLGDRYGTPLPAERIARYIDGRETVAAHGSREMPVWGERFAAPEPEDGGHPARIDRRIAAIIAYLQTLRVETPH
jgi:mono/diheme cytochrome c family protein